MVFSNVVFRTNKANVASGSFVFRDMFETGSGGDEIPVAEAGKVLEAVLPYCYPDSIEPIDVDSKTFWEVLKAFDKYQVRPPQTHGQA